MFTGDLDALNQSLWIQNCRFREDLLKGITTPPSCRVSILNKEGNNIADSKIYGKILVVKVPIVLYL